MSELWKFIFSSFWVWSGTLVLLLVAGQILVYAIHEDRRPRR